MRLFTCLFVFYLCSLCANVNAQDTIQMNNGSFEDVPRQGIIDVFGRKSALPSPWYDCGVFNFPNQTPPDIHPNNYFKVNKTASDGRTYLGMVARDDDTQESISQRLSGVLEGGKCYTFSVDLCRSDTYVSPNPDPGERLDDKKFKHYTKPIVLRIYGGSGICYPAVSLGESEAVKNTEWQRYDFEFTPKQNIRYITFEAFYKTPTLMAYSGNLLLDNMSDIVQIACPGEEPLAMVEVAKQKKKLPAHKRKKDKPKKKEEVVVDNSTKVVKKKEKKILAELDRSKLTKGQTIRIEKLYFKADSTNVEPESFEVLQEIYSFLKNNEDIIIEVGGHTNGKPKHKYCDQISSERAKNVAKYLIRKGIPSTRLQYKGYGKRAPIASNKTIAGRKKNQRVEIKIISLDSE